MGYGQPPDEPETGAGSEAPASVVPLRQAADVVAPSATSHGAADPVVEFLLRLGDDRLVLGHRLSEWCGHAPILEEDIALANIALDCIGHASLLLARAGALEGAGRDEDALAYHRDAVEFRNALLMELPNGDFAFTIARQFLVDAFAFHAFQALAAAPDEDAAGIAAKAHKETTYHLRHSAEWMLRLGDGTAESHMRAQRALEHAWPYTGELFADDAVTRAVTERGWPAGMEALRAPWLRTVTDVVTRATLTLPDDGFMHHGGRQGRHTEHLGHLLAEMQIVARSHPGATW